MGPVLPSEDSDQKDDPSTADHNDASLITPQPQATDKVGTSNDSWIDLTAVDADDILEPKPMETAEDLIEASQSLEWDDYCDSSPPNKRVRTSL